jgi:hypothetical protein
MARLELTAAADEGLICTVVLSRRNLLSLLAKLEGHPTGSKRRIENNDCWRDGEPVDEHYSRRPAPPGPMHPATESYVGANRGYTKGPQG